MERGTPVLVRAHALSPPPAFSTLSLFCSEPALYFDLDGTFDPLRLEAALRAHLGAMGLNPPQVAAAAQAALARLTLCTPSSSFAWLAALRALPLLLTPPTAAAPPPPRLILVDNAAAFYWPDRARPGVPAVVAAVEAAALAGAWGGAPAAARPRPRPPAALTAARVAGAAAACLRSLARAHRCAVVVARHSVLPGASPSVGWSGFGGGGGGAEAGGLPPDAAAPPGWATLATRRAALAPGPPSPAGPASIRLFLEWVPTPAGGPVPPGEGGRALLEVSAGGVQRL